MTLCRFLIGLLFVGLVAAGADAGQVRAIPRRPSTTRRAATRPAAGATTLLRELPRQALLITAAEQFGLPAAGDHSVDFAGDPTGGTTLACKLAAYDLSKKLARVLVLDANGKELRAIDLPVPTLDQNYPDYAKVAATVESWCDSQFVPLLAAEGHAAKPFHSDPKLDLPADVELLLAQMDPQCAFLAARKLHAEIASTGESPRRLAALVRAYANLAEATRYLYSPHASAFFARALVYAERAARMYPDDPIVHAARGYAYTLLGELTAGRAAFDKARALPGGNELPDWAKLADDLNHFRTRALFDRVDGSPSAPLASYFMLLTVEHSGMETLTINAARLALENNPGALRVINIMTDNSGVSLQHETTAQYTAMQFQLLSKLADAEPDDPAIPKPVREAAATAKRRSFAPDALLQLLATMDAQPAAAEAGQMLPWSTYASISRDALLVACFRRMYFTDHMYAVDSSNRLAAWWPMIKEHRYAPIIGGFDHTGKFATDREMVGEVREADLSEIYHRLPHLTYLVKGHNPPGWIENYEFTSDNTVYDLARDLWVFHGPEADAIPMLGMIKGEIAKSIAVMCPDHPSALAELIVNRWPETKARAAEIERDMGGNPQVAFALARAYRSEKRFADAARLIDAVIKVAPDKAVYEELAEMYKEQGDADKWLEVYDKYLANTEEFGLEHARKNEQIAYALWGMKKYDKALKYAKEAADSYSGWGLECYAACLTALGRYDEAEEVEKANQERYDYSFAWYRWCQTTGRGDLESARKLSVPQAQVIEAQGNHNAIEEATVYFELEGQTDHARNCWQSMTHWDSTPLGNLSLALMDLEAGKPDADAAKHLEHVKFPEMPKLPPEFLAMIGGVTAPSREDEQRVKIYKLAVDEFKRCLADPKAVPSRDGDRVKMMLEASDHPSRGSVTCLFGRLCEIRGNKDEAKWWYRQSLETTNWNFKLRPIASVHLRKLGEDFYATPAAAGTPAATAPAAQ